MDAKEKKKHYQSGANLLSRYYKEYKNVGKVQEEKPKEAGCSAQQVKTKEYVSSASGNASDEKYESSNLCYEKETREIQSDGEKSAIATKILTLSEVQLHSVLLKSLEHLKLSALNEVQLKLLSCFADGKFCIKLCAPSKSGKTTAVIISIVNEFLNDKNKKGLQALILCPTYELAEKCYSFTLQLTQSCPLKPCLAVKGKKFNENKKITDELIIATPDKLSAIISSLSFRKIQFIFFDDVDCLRNPKSHFNIFSQICDKMSPKCRVIVSTSSSSEVINQFVEKYIPYNTTIKIQKDVEKRFLQQFYIICKNIDDKIDALVHLKGSKSYSGQTIIFCETRDAANQLEILLKDKGIQAVKLVGSLPLAIRNDILEKFKKQEIETLITTRAFVNVVSNEQVTKIVNAEVILNKDYVLDLIEYNRRECLICEEKSGFIANFVDEKYEYLFGDGENPREVKKLTEKTKGTVKEELKVNPAIQKITLKRFITIF